MADIKHNVFGGVWLAGATVSKTRNPAHPEDLIGHCARGGAGCATGMKQVQLEMGGKHPMVVLDASDPELADHACLNGECLSPGQRCTASSLGGLDAGRRAMDFSTSVRTTCSCAGE